MYLLSSDLLPLDASAIHQMRTIQQRNLDISASLHQEDQLCHILCTNQAELVQCLLNNLLAAWLNSVCRNSAKAWSEAVTATPKSRSSHTTPG